MATTTTGLQLLQLFLQRRGVGLYLANSQIGSISATSVVSVFHYRNLNWGTNQLRSIGAAFSRPSNATGIADDYRPCGDLTSSTGSVAVDTQADTTLGTEDYYQLNHGIHPQVILDAMNLALRQLYLQNEDWLSLAADPGFQSTGTTSYVESDADGGPATTFSKITTADSFNVYPGFIASGRILNAAANGYIRQRFKITRGKQIAVWWLARADVGASGAGMSLVLYDLTNSALLGTAINSDEENWQVLHRLENVTSGAAGTEDLEVRLQAIGTIDDLYNNGLIVYRPDDAEITLSTTWENRNIAPALSYVTFGANTADGVEQAFSLQRHPIDREAYQLVSSRPGANPFKLAWNINHPFYSQRWRYPILIQGRRAHSDVDGPFTRVLTETTSCDRDLFEARMAVNVFANEHVRVPNQDKLLAKAVSDLNDLDLQFPLELPLKDHNSFRNPV